MVPTFDEYARIPGSVIFVPFGNGWVSEYVVSPLRMVGPMVTVESGLTTPSWSAPPSVITFATEPGSTTRSVLASRRWSSGVFDGSAASYGG
jgi:hypothetical protein